MKKIKDGYKMTELGELPVEWEVGYLENIAQRLSGHTPDKKICKYWNGDIPWISLKDTKRLDKRYISETTDYTTEEGIKNSSAVMLPRGTVVLSRDATVGKVGITDKKMATSQHFINYVCGEKLNNLYLYYDFYNRKPLFERIGVGSTIKTIGLPFFKSLNIVLPSVKEQQKIADILSTVDDKIENTENILGKTKELKKGLMQRLLTKGIGHDRFKNTDIGEIPEKWEVISLNNLGETYTGLSGKSKEDFGKGKPYIPYKNIFNNTKVDISYLDYVNIEKNEQQNVVQYGDVFFTTSSETPEEVGMSSVILDEIEELYLNSFCFGYRLNSFEILSPNYARYLLRGDYIRKKMNILAQGSTRFNLSKNSVLQIKIPIPPLKEQLLIASILFSIDEKIEQYKSKKEKLQELKKGLMQKLLTGMIRVKI